MKIRDGHVSNSSSSSFVFVMKTKDYKKLLKTLSGVAKVMAENLAWKNMARDMVMISHWSDYGGNNSWDHLGFRDVLEKEVGIVDPDDDSDENDYGWDKIHDGWNELWMKLQDREAIYQDESEN